MVPVSTDETATLRIKYEIDGLIPAVDVAAMLKEVATAFERYVKPQPRYRTLRLAVASVEVSSLVADLVVMGVASAQAAFLHRQVLYDFIGFIADTLSIAKGLSEGKAKPSDLRLIEAIQKPIAKGGAQQVNLYIVGDGNVVNIDRDAIQLMQTHRDQKQRDAFEASYRSLDEKAIAARPSSPNLLTLEGKFGTVFDVKGEWYVRLEGEGGVLNPLQLAHGVTVRDGHAYQFDGVWESKRYYIRAARPLL
ncbi:hypothetical protein CSW62_20045 [Caulobacter sp. FWC2]|nr:hypothetical protein CSW62_20045 [Caulobacter sp. FWC2]